MKKDDVCVKSWLTDIRQHDCKYKTLVPQDNLLEDVPTIGYRCDCGEEFSIFLDVVRRSSVKNLLDKYFKTIYDRYDLVNNEKILPEILERCN